MHTLVSLCIAQRNERKKIHFLKKERKKPIAISFYIVSMTMKNHEKNKTYTGPDN